ncbi:MAG TPA: pyridoxamine 5'-phosphate oxidase family protein [Solirubrobacteraceae bacterium]|nr:pyridoxamine 5'-phosphate oxidase family protein [Solirubrobacteraceae bacterium]
MSGRRDQIRMSDAEVRAFLDESRTVTCATNGVRGWPHLMPLWFIVRQSGPQGSPELWAWTFAKSQKTRNLERDPRATLQLEAGTEYHLLRGVMFETDVVIHRDHETVLGVGLDVFRRYAGGASGELAEEVAAMVARQAEKRVAFQFVERRRASWDHSKLGGVY